MGDPSASSLRPRLRSPGLTVTGQWKYYDRDDNYVGVPNLLVQLVNGDTGAHLAFAYTNSSGNYTFPSVTNPGSAGARVRLRSYVKWDPYGDELMVVPPDYTASWNNTFYIYTAKYTSGDGTLNVGTWYIPNAATNEGAFWIANDLNRAWLKVWGAGGSSASPQQTAGPGRVEWANDSTHGTHYHTGGNIHLTGEDKLSPFVVIHEYGHGVMYTVYGNWFPDTNCPSPHYMNRESHENCAWTEGWADFFAIWVQGDPTYRWPSGASLNLETPTWGTANWDAGEKVEGRVAGALWDIVDTTDEGYDVYSGGGSRIWYTLYNHNNNTFLEFWNSWKSRGYNSESVVWCIYQNTITWSGTISPHRVWPSNAPSGSSSGNAGQSLAYSAGGAICNQGHSVQYRFDWDDGTYSSWSSSTSASKSWSAAGSYHVLAQAGCATTTSIVSSWSSAKSVQICVIPSAPTGVSATDGTYGDRVRVSWTAVSGATRYEVYRAAEACGTYTKVGESTTISYDNTTVTALKVYWYKVKACNACGCSAYSGVNPGYAGTPGAGTAAVFRVDQAGNVRADGAVYGQCFYGGSADVAEWITVSEPVEAGDVLELDPWNPGQYRKAVGPCSSLVAGVVSTEPALSLGGVGVEGQALLALVGMVPVKACDENGPIALGDLVVPSSIPGYVMRWDDERFPSCMPVGKALQELSSGTGAILILLMR